MIKEVLFRYLTYPARKIAYKRYKRKMSYRIRKIKNKLNKATIKFTAFKQMSEDLEMAMNSIIPLGPTITNNFKDMFDSLDVVTNTLEQLKNK